MASTLTDALDAYRDAVARRAFWEDNGHRLDGRLEEARAAETVARRAVLTTARHA